MDRWGVSMRGSAVSREPTAVGQEPSAQGRISLDLCAAGVPSGVRALTRRILTAIQLTRLTMAFGAVADVWLVILLSRALASEGDAIPVVSMPLVSALALGAVVAVGLFAYGASLNDVLDARHDSAFSPERPIPAGRIRAGQAIVVTVGALLIAILAAQAMGLLSLQMTLLTAMGILFYNAAGKFIPAAGMISIGLIHAVHMFIPNAELGFTWPAWLVMTHAMAIAYGSHLLEGKRPRISRHAAAVILGSWMTWSGAIIGLGFWREGAWPDRASAVNVLWPALAVVGFIAVARWKTIGVSGAVAAEKLRRYGAMWQALYGSAWLLMLDLRTQAVWLGAFAVLGFSGMTIIKEVAGQAARRDEFRE